MLINATPLFLWLCVWNARLCEMRMRDLRWQKPWHAPGESCRLPAAKCTLTTLSSILSRYRCYIGCLYYTVHDFNTDFPGNFVDLSEYNSSKHTCQFDCVSFLHHYQQSMAVLDKNKQNTDIWEMVLLIITLIIIIIILNTTGQHALADTPRLNYSICYWNALK